ncbi:MAG: hypothetical protein ACT4OP_05690 [Actinomycetota bacterium]
MDRGDGTVQATYNSWPLHFLSGDMASGDISGQGLGGEWFALGPVGRP